MEIYSYFCFFSTVLVLNLIDYKRFGTIITPISFLSLPFTTIVILCIIFNRKLDFVTLYAPSLWVWTFGLFLFWLSQFVLFKIKPVRYSVFRKRLHLYIKDNNKDRFLICNTIFVVRLIFALIRLRSVSVNLDVGSKEVGEEMGVGGMVGRIANILIMAMPFYFNLHIRIIKKVFIVLLISIFIISLGSKTWTEYAFLTSFIVCFLLGQKIKWRYVVFGISLLFLLFILYYGLKSAAPDSSKFLDFVFRHFYFYLTSGLLPMSEYFKNEMIHISSGITLPFINIINVWLGDSGQSIHSEFSVITDNIVQNPSNVMSFFGTLWIEGGFYSFIFFSIFSGLISYGAFRIFRTNPNIFSAISFGFTLTILFFGFYNWGFVFLRIWEIYAMSFIFYYINKFEYALQINRINDS